VPGRLVGLLNCVAELPETRSFIPPADRPVSPPHRGPVDLAQAGQPRENTEGLHALVPRRGTEGPRTERVTGVGRGRYALAWERFCEHLDAIGEVVGAPPAVLHERTDEERARHAWCLTFDDGGASALEVGEELRRRGWRAYFFVTTGLIGRSGFVSEDAIRELDRMGHVVGSHSVTHANRMSSLPADRIFEEWNDSVAVLSELLGREVCTGSIPGGSYGRNVAVLAARAGITTLFTSEPVTTPRTVNDCVVIGRYPVLCTTTAAEASRAATGHVSRWLPRYVGWNVRKVGKAAGGTYYDRARRTLLRGWYRSPFA
jgi:peptidoglycan/xylan/chitin deacetylase (PgdA/CDA1 family)